MLAVQILPRPIRAYIKDFLHFFENTRSIILTVNFTLGTFLVYRYSAWMLQYFYLAGLLSIGALAYSAFLMRGIHCGQAPHHIPLRSLMIWIAKLSLFSLCYLVLSLGFLLILIQEGPPILMGRVEHDLLNWADEFALYGITYPWLCYTLWSAAQLILWQKTGLNGSMVRGFGLYLPKQIQDPIVHNAKVMKDMMTVLLLSLKLSLVVLFGMYLLRIVGKLDGFKNHILISTVTLSALMPFFSSRYCPAIIRLCKGWKDNLFVTLMIIAGVFLSLCMSVGEFSYYIAPYIPNHFNELVDYVLSRLNMSHRWPLLLMAGPVLATPWVGSYLAKWAKDRTVMDMIWMHVMMVAFLCAIHFLLSYDTQTIVTYMTTPQPLFIALCGLVLLGVLFVYWKQSCDVKIRHGSFSQIGNQKGKSLDEALPPILLLTWIFVLLIGFGGWAFVEIKLVATVLWLMIWIVPTLPFAAHHALGYNSR